MKRRGEEKTYLDEDMLPPSSDEEEEFEGEESEEEGSEEEGEEEEEEKEEVENCHVQEEKSTDPTLVNGNHFEMVMATALMGVPQRKPVKKVGFAVSHE